MRVKCEFGVGKRLVWASALALAAALGGTGCGQAGGAGADDVGVVRLNLIAPAGVGCVRLQFEGVRSVVRDVAVNGQVTTRLDGLPTGPVTVTSAAYAAACGAGDPLWLADALAVTLVAGQPTDVRIIFRKNGIAVVSTDFVDDVSPAPINLALNASCAGTPSPLESDSGWGGGSNKCDIVDGQHSYDTWARGLAFTGGHQTSAGGPPWVEPAGVRHAVIDFGAPTTFGKIILWWHGVEYTPQLFTIDTWNGSSWVPLSAVQRTYGTMHEEGSNSGYSDSDIYTFAPVTGSKVRYSFDNSLNNINGTLNIHGWLYEFEVYARE
jgi:hypothetical protein